MKRQPPPQLKRWGGLALVILAFIQQLASLRLELQQHDYPQALLSGMVVTCLLGLGVSTTWRRLSIRVLRPFILWFSTVFFLFFSYTTLTSTEPVETSQYVSHLFLVAACYVLLPAIPAAIISGLSALILAVVVLLHPNPDLQRLLSTVFQGFLISFLTMYGQSLRQDDIQLQPGASPDPSLTLARLQEFTSNRLDKTSTALLIVEVELYWNLLDVYGPLYMRQLMERLERQLRTNLSSSDYVWPYGEARFLVLLTQVNADSAANQGQHLIHLCNEVQVRAGDMVRASGGLAFLNERSSVSDVADLALARLYRARRSGPAQLISSSVVKP